MDCTDKYSQHSSIVWPVGIQATIESRLTLKPVRDMTITYSQMHRSDMYSQRISIIWVQTPLLSLKLEISHLF